MALSYNYLSKNISDSIINDRKIGWKHPLSVKECDVIRRNNTREKPNILRSEFVRDTEKIIHIPAYNRYADKTQVFSLYNNDDISRRSLHVQLVSRIARNIGFALGLNIDLIEAIALGHDFGHSPFGHAGETYLNDLLNNETGEHFNHNVQSVRFLDHIYKRNISLQTLDGILCHDGEKEKKLYCPSDNLNFEAFDLTVNNSRKNGIKNGTIPEPSTLEGCVVKVSDMIAYLGKDRQDALKANIIENLSIFGNSLIGVDNAELINNLTVDVVENSYRKDYISFSDECFEALQIVKSDNYSIIYKNESVHETLENYVKPMFKDIYYKLLDDLTKENFDSVIYKHYIDYITENSKYYGGFDFMSENPNLIVSDYISSMTDDYFISLYTFLFPDKKHGLEYKSYFTDIKRS